MTRAVRTLLGAAIALLAAMTGLGLLVAHVLAHGWFGTLERSWDAGLADGRTSRWNEVTALGSHVAATQTIVVVAAVATAGAATIYRRWREPVFIAVAVIGEVLIFTTTTLLVHRPRPNLAMDGAPPTSSFPSGHVAAATACYGALAVLVWIAARSRWLAVLAVAVAVALPVVVAWSRVYRGMHYPSDVMAGAMLGLTWLWVTKRTLLLGVDHAVMRRDTPENTRITA